MDSLEGKRILITGGAGFIGSHLARALCSQNEVVVLDSLSYGNMRNLEGCTVEFVRGDVMDSGVVETVMRDVDIVYHLAAVMANDAYAREVSVKGTWNVLRVASLLGAKVVYASSAAVYGDCDCIPIDEEKCLKPISFYGHGKVIAEQLCKQVDAVVLRYFNVYGKNGHGVVSAFLGASRNGNHLVIYGNGMQTRDFVHVDDVVRATVAASLKSGVFNVGSGHCHTVNEVASIVMALSGGSVIYDNDRDGDIRHSFANIHRAI